MLQETTDTQNIPSFLKEVKEVDETNKKVIKEFTVKDSSDEIFCVKYDPNDQCIAYGCEDGQIRFLNLENMEITYLLGSPKMKKSNQMPITCLSWKTGSFNPPTERQLMACSSNGRIYCWKPFTNELLYDFQEEMENEINCLDYSDKNNQFATAGHDHRIRLYDDETQKMVRRIKGSEDDQLGHSNRIFTVKYLPEDSNLLVSAGWDNTVFIWDIRTEGPPVSHILGPNVCGESIDIFGDTILAGSYNNDKNLCLMSIKDAMITKQIKWYDSDMYKGKGLNPPCLYGARFTRPDAKYIVAGGTHRNEVRIFEVGDNFSEIKGLGSITGFSGACLSIDVANTYEPRFIVGTATGVLKSYRITEGE